MRVRAALCALAIGALPLRAQDVSFLVGASRVRYADSLDGNAGALGVRLGFGHGLRGVSVEGAYSRFTEGGWAVQGAAQGTVLWPVSGTVLVGVAAGGGVNDYEGGLASGTGAIGPLLSLRGPRTQLVVGASAGGVRDVDGRWSRIGNGSVRGSWMLHSGVNLDAGATGSLTDSLAFADFTVQVRVAVSRLRVGILGGARAGDLADRPWGLADLAWDIAAPVTLEAAAGRYPEDITGFSDGLYAQVGLRIHAMRRSHPLARSPGIRVERLDERRVLLHVRYRRPVGTLRIAGDWNGWLPMALEARGHGEWVVELVLAPGSYQYALVADDAWVLPDGVVGLDDGFGGQVARLLVGGAIPGDGDAPPTPAGELLPRP